MKEKFRMRIFKAMVLLICTVAPLLLVGCGGNNKEDEATIKDWKKETNIIYDLNAGELNRIKANDGNVVFSIVDNNTEYFYYTSCELEYQPFELLQVDMTNVDILDYCVDTNGEIFYLELEAQEGQEKIFLKKIGLDGNTQILDCLNDFHRGEKDDCYQWRVILKPDGHLLVYSFYGAILFDSIGNRECEENWEKKETFELTYVDSDTVFVKGNDNYELSFYTINLKTKEKVKCVNMPELMNNFILKCEDDSICVCTTSGLYCYNINKQSGKYMIQWSDYGVIGDNICYLYKENDRIHCVLYEENVLSDIAFEEDASEKIQTEIVLGCIEETTQLHEAVANFNNRNDEITIVIHNYYKEDKTEAINRLYNDVLIGKGPDIINFSAEDIDERELGRKGLLENLIPYLEKSDVIGKADIVDSAYQALLTNDDLYMLPTNFVLYTIITKDKWCSNKETFTLDEALKAAQNCEEKGLISQDDFLWGGATSGGYSCEADDKRLEQYIEIAKKLPQQESYQPDGLLRREGEIPFELLSIANVQQYLYEKSVWGEDAVFTGFPEADGNGMIFHLINCLGISSQSAHKEEAWKFLESYFTEEGQKTIAPNWNFSILQETLEQQLVDACKQEYYQTPDGKTEKIPILTYEIDGKSENVYAAQDEDIKEFKEIIDNVKIVQRKDSPIIGIVQAEALYYFDGQKSMKETIDTMKNRIEIYEKENSY